MHLPIVEIVAVNGSAPWDVGSLRAFARMAAAPLQDGKSGPLPAAFATYVDDLPDTYLADRLQLRDGPSLLQSLIAEFETSKVEHQLRIEKPLADETRARNETHWAATRGSRPKGTGEHDAGVDRGVAFKAYKAHRDDGLGKRAALRKIWRTYWPDLPIPTEGKKLDKWADKVERWGA